MRYERRYMFHRMRSSLTTLQSSNVVSEVWDGLICFGRPIESAGSLSEGTSEIEA